MFKLSRDRCQVALKISFMSGIEKDLKDLSQSSLLENNFQICFPYFAILDRLQFFILGQMNIRTLMLQYLQHC